MQYLVLDYILVWTKQLQKTPVALEKEMATCFSILAREIPWTEEPSDLYPWGHKESVMTE